ncbi:hypothetical protein BOQ63_004415 (plasmid) [Streptomyces viridifaciens]|nr:hypothetical protein BOQ63_004415 [Streptomyces viridifaciens]
MTLAIGAVHGFAARNLLAHAGVDPDGLRLDAYEQVDRGVALSGFDSERSELVEGAVAIASEILRRWRTPRPELVAGLVRCLESRHPHARGDAAMLLVWLVRADSTQDVMQDVTPAVPAWSWPPVTRTTGSPGRRRWPSPVSAIRGPWARCTGGWRRAAGSRSSR